MNCYSVACLKFDFKCCFQLGISAVMTSGMLFAWGQPLCIITVDIIVAQTHRMTLGPGCPLGRGRCLKIAGVLMFYGPAGPLL